MSKGRSRSQRVVCVILAAGESTRMKSDLVKVLHPLCGRPVIQYVVDVAVELGSSRTIVVVGRQMDKVAQALRGQPVEFVTQAEQKGTAHAVQQTRHLLSHHRGTVLILYGDVPLLRVETVQELLRVHEEEQSSCTVLTAHTDAPTGYGRILRTSSGSLRGIVEEKDATSRQKALKEINTGIYCFQTPLLFQALKKVHCHNVKGEYYLTDVIEILRRGGAVISSSKAETIGEAMGINTRKELAVAERVLRLRILDRMMLSGVSIRDPETTFVDATVQVGRDSTIHPHCYLEQGTTIGRACTIGPFSRIIASQIQDGARVFGFSVLEGVVVKPGEYVSPFEYRHG